MRRTRVTLLDLAVPALISVAGITFLAAGLLSIGGRADAGASLGSPLPFGAAHSMPSSVVPSLPPVDASPSPATSSGAPATRVATRIVIEALGIDLPVIDQPDPTYPACNVAMYLEHPGLGQPGSGKSVYLYAHARTGMFGPLFERAILGLHGGSASLIGMPILIYTSDDHLYEYAIAKVHPRVPANTHFLDGPVAVKSETLWLQTSTGPNATYPKLQVEATPTYDEPATHADAHPKARPIDCS